MMQRPDRSRPKWSVRTLACGLALAGCFSGPATNEQAGAAPLAAVRAPEVGLTKPIAVVAGAARPEATPFYGTDLGWTFAHQGELWVMFGDTWASFLGDGLRPDADDTLGKISLRDFPNGDFVELWTSRHPAPAGAPPWQAGGPTLRVPQDASGDPTPVQALRDGVALSSGPGLTPTAGFSNARSGEAAGAFALFVRNEPLACDDEGQCENDFDCDRDLGRCAPVEDDLSPPCVLGTTSCWCVRVATGLCVDSASSVYSSDSERGRSHAVVMRQPVGNALHGEPTRFPSRTWATRRFFNATARTVKDFDPGREDGVGNDYATADGSTPERDGVFIWGRPNFGGVSALGRDAQLYLAWVRMPSYDPDGQFAWEPQYFAGIQEDGRPRFVAREVDALPLDLDAAAPGHQASEVHDLVGQMSISWVPTLGRFVMIYGGGIGSFFTDKIFGADAESMQLDPLGALYIRYAEHPWGPWTRPEPLVLSGNPRRGIPGYYGPGGLLYHDECRLPGCAPGEFPFVGDGEQGRLYAPGIIDAWTMPRGPASVDLYWHVSTWNPYQVVLMKTRLGR